MSRKKSRKDRDGRLAQKAGRHYDSKGNVSRKLKEAEEQPGWRAKKGKPLMWMIIGLILVLAGLVAVLKFRTPGTDLRSAPSCNVLLITLDTTRADHLGCYGYKKQLRPISTVWLAKAGALTGSIAQLRLPFLLMSQC